MPWLAADLALLSARSLKSLVVSVFVAAALVAPAFSGAAFWALVVRCSEVSFVVAGFFVVAFFAAGFFAAAFAGAFSVDFLTSAMINIPSSFVSCQHSASGKRSNCGPLIFDMVSFASESRAKAVIKAVQWIARSRSSL
ncbi:hypothetical protein C8024_15725 [Sphingopyxis sp. BSNA05]|nr:hypothetical protein [Sphingopyxis sp. BSNA05]